MFSPPLPPAISPQITVNLEVDMRSSGWGIRGALQMAKHQSSLLPNHLLFSLFEKHILNFLEWNEKFRVQRKTE